MLEGNSGNKNNNKNNFSASELKNSNSNDEIPNNKKKIILLVTDNIQHYQKQFNNYDITDYKITFINWSNILNFITNFDDVKRRNVEIIVLNISVTEYEKINILPITIKEIRKIFFYQKIFFILPSKSMIEKVVSMEICTKEDIRIQPISVFDILDLIGTTKKKKRLDRLQLKDHGMSLYSSSDDKVNDAIRFLKIGIKNNETTLLLLSIDIEPSYLQSKMELHGLDMSKLQNDGLLNISYSEDWYLSFQKNIKKNIVTIDNEKVYLKWNNLIKQSLNNGRKGLRVFSMMDCFFEYGLFDELIDYGCIGPPKFNKPFLGFCAYEEKHILQLSEDQIRKLVLTHSTIWI